MKNAKTLIVLMLLIAVLLLAFFLLKSGILDKPREQSQKIAEEVTVYAFENPPLSMICESSGKALSFKGGAKWESLNDPRYPISPETLGKMASFLSKITATRILPEDCDSSLFGLEAPVCAVTFSLSADIPPKKLIFGNKNTATTDYYARLDGDGKIFTVKAENAEIFMQDILSYVDIPEIPDFETAAVRGFSLNGKKSEPDDKLISRLNSFYLSSVADPFTENLAQYGLDSPAFELTVNDFTLKIGNFAGERYYYAETSIHPGTVYRAFEMAVEPLLNYGGSYETR